MSDGAIILGKSYLEHFVIFMIEWQAGFNSFSHQDTDSWQELMYSKLFFSYGFVMSQNQQQTLDILMHTDINCKLHIYICS